MMAGVGVLALLFAQLTVAAYACPAPESFPAVEMMDIAASNNAGPCQKIDEERANLCKQHCKPAAQSVNTTAPLAIDLPVWSVLPFIPIAIQPSPHPTIKQYLQDNLLSHNAGPPLPVRNCRFQI